MNPWQSLPASVLFFSRSLLSLEPNGLRCHPQVIQRLRQLKKVRLNEDLRFLQVLSQLRVRKEVPMYLLLGVLEVSEEKLVG